MAEGPSIRIKIKTSDMKKNGSNLEIGGGEKGRRQSFPCKFTAE